MAHQPIPGPSSGSSSSSGFQYLNSPFGNTTYTKVFVGGLAWETQSETMGRYFEQFGEILEAVVITDKNTGRSKGYGFVTFREPEAAKRACADPTPIIDGRRANCNLASLGRPRPPLPYGRLRPATPYIASVPRGTYVGNFGYPQPLSYSYQQGLMYHPYGYAAYGPECVYPQGVYNPYAGQQYLQIYGVPGTVNTAIYPYGQLGQTLPGGHGYTTVQGYAIPGHHVMQFGGPNVNAITSSPVPTIQAPYPAGWFSWNNIHECEVRFLPEFFDSRSPSKNPRVYMYYRNSIIKYFRRNPSGKITFTEVRKRLYDLTLCARCYVRGNYRVGVSSSDFRRVEISEEIRTEWTEKETLQLLEAVAHYGDDWKKVALHVPGRSEKDCVSHFIKLPFGKNLRAAFLSALVGTEVAEAAAQAAVAALTENEGILRSIGKLRDKVLSHLFLFFVPRGGAGVGSNVNALERASLDANPLPEKEQQDAEKAISRIIEVQMKEIQDKIVRFEEMDLLMEKSGNSWSK
ncbi:hypothetical protein GH714_007465 [Hevea brasiliensis]|uniref:Uncharacterized protein n=1 Tax=Hevea brasiliensis TaxID=3981 RepID=A0A6A6MAG4_HEVBR|nr:hypothetical protein GH714_007465 [Hevea brasiliensis]